MGTKEFFGMFAAAIGVSTILFFPVNFALFLNAITIFVLDSIPDDGDKNLETTGLNKKGFIYSGYIINIVSFIYNFYLIW